MINKTISNDSLGFVPFRNISQANISRTFSSKHRLPFPRPPFPASNQEIGELALDKELDSSQGQNNKPKDSSDPPLW
jgi:hypothetical protein